VGVCIKFKHVGECLSIKLLVGERFKPSLKGSRSVRASGIKHHYVSINNIMMMGAGTVHMVHSPGEQ
jgi:hypothetical protein